MVKKLDIIRWLDKYFIENYLINEDLSINVNGDVYLYNMKIENLPYKFNTIFGDFRILNCELKTLKNCPNSVYESFACSYNPISSLDYLPKKIGGNFYCSATYLTELNTFSSDLEGNFYHCVQNETEFFKGFEHYYEKERVDCDDIIFQYKMGVTGEQIRAITEHQYLNSKIIELEEHKVIKV
jgi:hypothetical protein